MTNFSEEELKQYTKEELIFYLKNIQSYIPNYTEPIRKVILHKRYEEISDKIKKILTESAELVNKYNNTLDVQILVKLQKLSKERDKLWAKEKKIEIELFGA